MFPVTEFTLAVSLAVLGSSEICLATPINHSSQSILRQIKANLSGGPYFRIVQVVVDEKRFKSSILRSLTSSIKFRQIDITASTHEEIRSQPKFFRALFDLPKKRLPFLGINFLQWNYPEPPQVHLLIRLETPPMKCFNLNSGLFGANYPKNLSQQRISDRIFKMFLTP